MTLDRIEQLALRYLAFPVLADEDGSDLARFVLAALPVVRAAMRVREVAKTAANAPTPARTNQQIIDSAATFQSLFDAIDLFAATEKGK